MTANHERRHIKQINSMPKRPNKSGLSHGIPLIVRHYSVQHLVDWGEDLGGGGEQKSSLTLDHERQTVRQLFSLHIFI